MRILVAGLIAMGAIVALSVFLFFRYKDPMLLVLGTLLAIGLGAVVGIAWVARKGVPVRVVNEK